MNLRLALPLALAACSGTSSSKTEEDSGTPPTSSPGPGTLPPSGTTPTGWTGTWGTSTRTWGTGRIYLVPWPPPTGVIEDDATSTVTGFAESRLGAALRRLPDVDADGSDELYAWMAGTSHDAFVIPLEGVVPGDQPTDLFLNLRDVRTHGAVADVTGDGVTDLVQAFDANAFQASVTVFDGTGLGALGGRLRYDEGLTRVETESFSNYGWPSAGIGDLDGVPGDEVVIGWRSFGYGGVEARGRVDLYTSGELDGSWVPTPDDARAHVEGRRTGEPWVAATTGLPDITGDGLPEVVSTQSEGDFEGVFEGGEIAVLDGATLLAGGTFDYDDALVRVGGELDYDKLGDVVLGLPDLDGDGLGELVAAGLPWYADRESLYVFRGADLAAGGVLQPANAAIRQQAWSPELLPDLDGDGVPELGAWDATGFVVWSGATIPVGPGGTLDDATRLGVTCSFRDWDLWGFDDGIGVAFVRGPSGWMAAFGGSGAM